MPETWELVSREVIDTGLLEETKRIKAGNGWIYKIVMRPDPETVNDPGLPIAYTWPVITSVYVPEK